MAAKKGTVSPEYVALKALLADVVDLLAGNAPVITQFSNHLFSSGLIPKAVHLNPKSSPLDRASQLINAALLAVETHPYPRSQFHVLVSSLQKVGLTQMAVKLQHNLGDTGSHLFKPLVEKEEQIQESPAVIQLDSKDEVARNIDALYNQFTDIATNLRIRFEELTTAGKVNLVHIARQAAEYLRRPVTSFRTTSIDELFDDLQQHYDFLNCSLLRMLASRFLERDAVEVKLFQYIESVDKLLESSQLKHIRSTIKEKLSFIHAPTTNGHTTLVVFKLHGRWEELTLENFKRVLKHYFGSKADFFSHIYFDYGSFLVAMLIPTSIAQSITEDFITSKDSMSRIGIFEVTIDKKIVFSVDYSGYDFEESLLQSFRARDTFEVTMLLQLGADPNYVERKGGETALMLDPRGEVFLVPPSLHGPQVDNEAALRVSHYLRSAGDGIRNIPDGIDGLHDVRWRSYIGGAIAALIGGISGMAVVHLLTYSKDTVMQYFFGTISWGAIGAVVSTMAFDRALGYSAGRDSHRVTRFRIAVDIARTFVGIGIGFGILGAIFISTFEYSPIPQRFTLSGHVIPLVIGATIGAVSALTVGPEALFGRTSSGGSIESRAGADVMRACFGVAAGAVFGSVGIFVIDIVPYTHQKTATIITSGLLGAIAGFWYYNILRK